jgi:hypothetical protein
MKKKEQQRIYNVYADLFSIPLSKAKNTFQIKCGRNVLGTLQFSRGSIQWFAKGKSTSTCDLTWKQFADLMERQGEL